MGKICKYLPIKILRNISSQSQNILDSRRLHFCKSCADTAPVSTDTGQMRYRRHIVLLLNLSCQSNGMSLGTAAGTISHAHISRLQCRDPQCCCLHISEIRTLLRRKYLKRDRCCIFIQNISDLHSCTLFLSFIFILYVSLAYSFIVSGSNDKCCLFLQAILNFSHRAKTEAKNPLFLLRFRFSQ